MGSKQKSSADSQAVRRIKFGLNIAVALIVSVGIVVLINWIAARQYLRLDLTANRSYSLSAQSITVLDQLDDGYRIVTVLPSAGEVRDEQTALVHRRVRDLAEEYARYADNVTAEHLDARTDVDQAEGLQTAIAQAYKDEIDPVSEAIQQGRAALRELEPINARMIEVATAALAVQSAPPANPAYEQFQTVSAECKKFEQFAREARQQADELLGQVLINYTAVKQHHQDVLIGHDRTLSKFILDVGNLVRSRFVDNASKERLLELADLSKQAQAKLKAPLEQMQSAKPAPGYDQVFYTLASGEAVAILGPDSVKVIPVSDMWRPGVRTSQASEPAQPQYLIEEMLTGALMSMTFDQPPMVVFVLSGSGSATGAQGQFQLVSQRLENADIRVRQWNPVGQASQSGPTPPLPRPTANPGQKTIWIVLPQVGQQMANPMMMAANPRQQIADLLEERIEAGDAAMVMLSYDPATAYGVANPITEWLSGWQITAQTDRIVVEEFQQSNRQTATSAQFLVNTWPSALPVTKALAGMQGVFMIVSPIIVGQDGQTTHHPLIELRGRRLWTHTDLSSLQAIQNAKFSEADSAESFLIGVASERDGKRLVTVAESEWAKDRVTSSLQLTVNGPALVFPANSELFVNSVLWLAGLEDLIAASPRSQDVPRINPMSDEVLWWHRAGLLIGVPAAALLLGLSVWVVRRRS